MGELDGKVAIVTGAGTGIGRSIAVRFATEGARVALAGRRLDPLHKTAELVAAAGGRSWVLACDQAQEAQVDDLFAGCAQHLGEVDILVNNAAVAGPVGPIGALSLADWAATLAANLTGPWLCSRAASRSMITRGSGKIVNIGSVSGKRPLANRTPYTTTKLGLVGLTRTLAVELGPHGINVNVISPGAVHTERLDQLAAAQAVDLSEMISQMTKLTALARISEPADIAEAALFFATDRSRNITGFDLTVDAGVWFS